MNEEILRIQKMVAAGKVTPEEATELVESLVRQSPAPAAPPAAEEKCPKKGGRLGKAAFVFFALGLFVFLLDPVDNCRSGNTSVMAWTALGLVFGLAGFRTLAGKAGLIGSALILALMLIAPLFLTTNQDRHPSSAANSSSSSSASSAEGADDM